MLEWVPELDFPAGFREGQLTEIMICLDETRGAENPGHALRCRTVRRSPGGDRPEAAGILRLLLQHLPPKPGDVSEISCYTPVSSRLNICLTDWAYILPDSPTSTRTISAPIIMTAGNPEAAEDEQQHWNMETVTLHTQQAMDYLRDGFNSRDPQSN